MFWPTSTVSLFLILPPYFPLDTLSPFDNASSLMVCMESLKTLRSSSI
jgi:hypothetical protein